MSPVNVLDLSGQNPLALSPEGRGDLNLAQRRHVLGCCDGAEHWRFIVSTRIARAPLIRLRHLLPSPRGEGYLTMRIAKTLIE